MAQFPNTSNSSGIWTLKDQRTAVMGANWPGLVIPLAYRNDPYAADLFSAITFSSSVSALTGGAYIDVAPQIRSAQGLTPGTAKTLNSGNGAQGAVTSTSPFSRYSSVYTFVNASVNADLVYFSGHALNSTGNLTLEAWVYIPTTRSFSFIHTNNFSGGYYQGYGGGASPTTDANPRRLSYFSNYASSLTSPNNVVPDAQWFHLAWVWTSGNLKFYVNGTSVASGTGNGANSQTTIAIGGTQWDGITSAQNRAGIQIADWRIYTTAKYSGNFLVDMSDTTKGGSITT